MAPEDLTLAPDLLDTARRLFDPGQRRELNPFARPPRLHADPRLEPGTWHAGAPVEGPLLPRQRHPDGPVEPRPEDIFKIEMVVANEVSGIWEAAMDRLNEEILWIMTAPPRVIRRRRARRGTRGRRGARPVP